MDTIGVGVIGCGARSRSILNGLRSDPRYRVTAVCDPSAESVAATRKMVGGEMRVYSDYIDLVTDRSVRWVLVGSWNCYHREHATAALRAGKHVFCEKPLATTLDDCIAIRDAVERSHSLFMIGFVLRYSSHYRKIRETVQSGTIGEIVSLEFNETLNFNHGGFIHGDWRRLRRNAGTHLLEKCCHDIDLMNWIVGSRARRVASFGGLDFFLPGNVGHMDRLGPDDRGRTAYRTWPSTTGLDPFRSDKDIYDNQVAIIEYANGVRATFHTNCNAGIPERRMYILGTEGAVRADVLTGQLQVGRIGFGEPPRELSGAALGGHGGADGAMVQRWAECMASSEPAETGIDDAIESAATCFGIDEAADTGSVVDMAHIWQAVDRRAVPPKRLRDRELLSATGLGIGAPGAG